MIAQAPTIFTLYRSTNSNGQLQYAGLCQCPATPGFSSASSSSSESVAVVGIGQGPTYGTGSSTVSGSSPFAESDQNSLPVSGSQVAAVPVGASVISLTINDGSTIVVYVLPELSISLSVVVSVNVQTIAGTPITATITRTDTVTVTNSIIQTATLPISSSASGTVLPQQQSTTNSMLFANSTTSLIATSASTSTSTSTTTSLSASSSVCQPDACIAAITSNPQGVVDCNQAFRITVTQQPR